MRLLNTKTLTLKEFFDVDIPNYAILSHRWVRDEEVSYEDFVSGQKHHTSGYRKILGACKLTEAYVRPGFSTGWDGDGRWSMALDDTHRDVDRNHGESKTSLEWVWVDTCCIDKRSSVELSEAINSMFKWYERAVVCFAYLNDVDKSNFCGHSRRNGTDAATRSQVRALHQSQWFSRGWTLQELLAPKKVLFYDENFDPLGTRDSLGHTISKITGIPEKYLRDETESVIEGASIAQRMSWASMRQTTRVEDLAYCLLGIFDINMPLLYGEGDKAFLRLQHAIVAESSDESIFAWTSTRGTRWATSLFAPSPYAFRFSNRVYRTAHDLLGSRGLERPSVAVTNRGYEMHVPTPLDRHTELISHGAWGHVEVLIVQLACYTDNPEFAPANAVFIVLFRQGGRWVRLGMRELLIADDRLAKPEREAPVYNDSSSARNGAFEKIRVERDATFDFRFWYIDESQFSKWYSQIQDMLSRSSYS